MNLRDLPQNAKLYLDSQDIAAILDAMGQPDDEATGVLVEFYSAYTDDILAVWSTHSSRPYDLYSDWYCIRAPAGAGGIYTVELPEWADKSGKIDPPGV